MELQTDLDLHGHRLLNEGVGGLAFDSREIMMHNVLNTNGYCIVGKTTGGFEVDTDGRVKLHGNLDLNKHGVHETLSFCGNNILLGKDFNMNGRNAINLKLGWDLDLNGNKINGIKGVSDRIYFQIR